MNKLFTFFLAFVASIGTLFASDTSVGGIWYNFNYTKSTAEVTFRGSEYDSYANEYTGAVTIPSVVTFYGKKYSVTSIGSEAFANCDGLASITIPNSVTSIGNDAFFCCYSLTSITIPNSVTSIGDGAFYGCDGLTSLIIPNSVTSIGVDAFFYCDGLISVTINSNAILSKNYSSKSGVKDFFGRQVSNYIIGDSVTSIGDYAFNSCTGLTSITIPNSVTSIGDDAFSGCDGLISVAIPNSVTSIGIDAFNECAGLISVTIGNSVTSIGDDAFSDCTGLTSVYINDIAAWCSISFDGVWSNPLYYAHHLYLNNEHITNLAIPNSVTNIGNYAFYGCSSLTSITIPNSVTSIGNDAFNSCTGLTSITIPNSVTSIGEDAFSYCDGLISVTINSNAILSKNYSSKSGVKAFFGTQVTNYNIGEDVTSIGNSAFSHCTGLISITISNSVTYIGVNAFQECTSLASIEIPNSVTSIRDYTFYGCSGLTSVTIGGGVTSIGGYAFHKCTRLISVDIPNGVTSIGEYAFFGCDSLTSITIANSVTSIGSGAFSNCFGLTSVYINDIAAWCSISFDGEWSNPLYYAHHLYLNNEHITNLDIPSHIASIGSYAFSGCSSLTSITIHRGCERVGDYAFAKCKNVRTITLSSTLTDIGESAFGTESVLDVYNYATTPQDMSVNNYYTGYGLTLLRGVLATARLHVPQQSIDLYKEAYFWCYFGSFLPLETVEPEAIDQIFYSDNSFDHSNDCKILHNGQILILRGDKTYTLTGQEIIVP